MKKIYFILLFLTASFIQAQNGITYQAVILNPKTVQIPGADNSRSPLANKLICLQFKIVSATKVVEYQEQAIVKTDEYGMVNLIIGTANKTGGTASNFASIIWDGKAKNLVVELDTTGTCSNFIEISNQPFTSVPFALFAVNSGTPGTAGATGQSAYQIAVKNGYIGTETQWLNSLNGTIGSSGSTSLINTTIEPSGTNCVSGGVKIETGLDNNKNGILETSEINNALTKYICTGTTGQSAYQVAVKNGFVGTEVQWLNSLIGLVGQSAYQVAVKNGYVGTEVQWLNSLIGLVGQSAYQVAVKNGYVGTEVQWLNSLIGAKGNTGIYTLLNTTSELAGTNCANGGTKIEVGLDTNSNGILESSEINNSLTKYICNGISGNGNQSNTINYTIDGF